MAPEAKIADPFATQACVLQQHSKVVMRHGNKLCWVNHGTSLVLQPRATPCVAEACPKTVW